MAWAKIDHNDLLEEYPNLKDYLPYLDELNNESPRGKVLISTGYLEQVLKEILCAYLIEDKVVEDLFEGGNAPLGTFSARAKLAYTLGLISAEEFHDIDLIRKIRNDFAHDMKASFKVQVIKNRCKLLKHKVPDHPDRPSSGEGQFATAATGLLLNLVNRAAYVSEKRRSYGKWKR
ncbi:MltR family transcriptional regulator [Bradyrhizobium sp. HKCCYLR1023]|uniref:MltR family transcriptional regulator n=1 Tax=Bradyrhizobium TaxID=374 RepID=UPI003EBCB294